MPAPRIAIDRLRQSTPLVTLILLMAVVGALQPSFLTPETLLQLASDTATLFVLACGSSFVIMLGGIDLSIQAMASLASVIVALSIDQLGYGSFALAVLAGALFLPLARRPPRNLDNPPSPPSPCSDSVSPAL